MKKIALTLVLAASIAPIAANAGAIKHKGSLEGGANFSRGNSESDAYLVEGKLESTYDNIINELYGKGSNVKTADVRTEEYYKAGDKARLEFTTMDYAFGQVEYINDRYAGFDRRTSEVVGYGRYFVKNDDLKVAGELGVGGRQTNYIDPITEDESTFLTKVGGLVDWKINEAVSYNNNSFVAFGEDNTQTYVENALKTSLSKNLYLKLSNTWENNSDVPAGKKESDIKTGLTFGYSFE